MTGELTIRVRSLVWFAAGVAITLIASALVLHSWPADAAPGDNDATLVPIEPCRLFDTRSGPNNVGPRSIPLRAQQPYTQQVTGTNGNCVGIPAGAVAVAMNVTIVNPTAMSNLRLYPADLATPPLVSNLNWLARQSPTPNKVDVKLSTGGAVNLLNHAGSVDVLGDVVGYYIAAPPLASYQTVEAPAPIPANNGHYKFFNCDPGDIAIGAWIRRTGGNEQGIDVQSVELDGGFVRILARNDSASAADVKGSATCLDVTP